MSTTCQRCGTSNPGGLANCSSCGAALRPGRGGSITLIVVVCVLGGLVLFCGLPGVIFPVFMRARGAAKKAICQSHLKLLALAVLIYGGYNNDRLPLAEDYPGQLRGYIKDNSILRCADDKGVPPSYSLVPEPLGVVLAEVKAPERTLILYEGRGGLVELRHSGAANTAFVDGHVKQVSPPSGPAPTGATVPLSTFEEWAKRGDEPPPGGASGAGF